MNIEIDLSWLLMVAEQYTPGDPRVTDYGSLVAAVTRHQAEIFDVLVYPEPEDRAAPLRNVMNLCLFVSARCGYLLIALPADSSPLQGLAC